MACKQGIRENIERSKAFHKKQKEYNPVRELWQSLVHRVHKTEAGFEGLTEPERLYYTVRLLDGEVYNGGMHQFFSNSSGKFYPHVIDGLLELRAFESLKLLREAKQILFGDADVQSDKGERNLAMKVFPETGAQHTEWCIRLALIDKEYWRDPDGLDGKLNAFADKNGLIEPFKKG